MLFAPHATHRHTASKYLLTHCAFVNISTAIFSLGCSFHLADHANVRFRSDKPRSDRLAWFLHFNDPGSPSGSQDFYTCREDPQFLALASNEAQRCCPLETSL
jgi:hypothetical protein